MMTYWFLSMLGFVPVYLDEKERAWLRGRAW